MTTSQVLGVQRALIVSANLEASVGYFATDARIHDLTNRIADARITQLTQIDQIAATLGITVDETPISLAIAAQSARDVQALRDARSIDDAYLDAAVLSEMRALGIAEHLLSPNAAASGGESVRGFIEAARAEWEAQLVATQDIQRSRLDWHFNSIIRDPAPIPQAR
jgi:hypothetical protein